MASTLTTLARLIDRHPSGLNVAPYQRHYVWGTGHQREKDTVRYLTRCLSEAYHTGEDYFLQGITLTGDDLVDGQQRLTYLCLLLRWTGYTGEFTLRYGHRPEAEIFIRTLDGDPATQDVALMQVTLGVFAEMLSDIDRSDFRQFILHRVRLLCIYMPEDADPVEIYRMINGTKSPMLAADIIKADIMRMASDSEQPSATPWGLYALRSRYAIEWEAWVRWWHAPEVERYYREVNTRGLDLLLKLCLRDSQALSVDAPLTYEEFRRSLTLNSPHTYHGAKHIFHLLRYTQRRFEEAFIDPAAYNMVKAVLLLQTPAQRLKFLQMYFVDGSIDADELARYYRLSFLGMTIDEIECRESAAERFDDLLASLSQADVYHTDGKREAYNLLLRLNIDEDIKLSRKFDFGVWSNRSLEHIYSKSKVWHIDEGGRVLDGNDNILRVPLKQLRHDPSYLHRDDIVNIDGTHLSEHCIGNLVLLYGQNNAEFGNAGFEQKKMMFLTPGDQTVFRSRNLLHSVCVFANRDWTARSIVENYNLTLKNLKLYYGYK